jgi:hypothetical protein
MVSWVVFQQNRSRHYRTRTDRQTDHREVTSSYAGLKFCIVTRLDIELSIIVRWAWNVQSVLSFRHTQCNIKNTLPLIDWLISRCLSVHKSQFGCKHDGLSTITTAAFERPYIDINLFVPCSEYDAVLACGGYLYQLAWMIAERLFGRHDYISNKSKP